MIIMIGQMIITRCSLLTRLPWLGRVDYMIVFPFVASYLQQQYLPNKKHERITIKEAKPYDLVYVSCANSLWGKQVINAVNAILIEQRPTQRYRNAFEYWLNGTSLKKYRTIYNQLLLQNDRLTPSATQR